MHKEVNALSYAKTIKKFNDLRSYDKQKAKRLEVSYNLQIQFACDSLGWFNKNEDAPWANAAAYRQTSHADVAVS